MTTLRIETFIAAPIELCFDAARDIGFHCRCAAHSNERAVAGVTSGLMELGDSITFEATHFWVRQRLSGSVTEFDRPHFFADEMTKGAFASFRHEHSFKEREGGTTMTDTLTWVAPLGVLGTVADLLFLRRHMRGFMLAKNALFKELIERGQYAAPGRIDAPVAAR